MSFKKVRSSTNYYGIQVISVTLPTTIYGAVSRFALHIICLFSISKLFGQSYASLPYTDNIDGSGTSLGLYWATSTTDVAGKAERQSLTTGSYPFFSTANSQKGSGYDNTLTTPSGGGIAFYNTSSLSAMNYTNADLRLNLAGKLGVTLKFHAVDVGSSFSADYIYIYLSTNGGSSFGSTYTLVNMVSTPWNDGKWNTVSVDVSALATSNGLTLSSTSVIRIQTNLKGSGNLSSPRTSEQMIFMDSFSATYTSTLPVELTSFSAENNLSGNTLSWTTASEISNNYFEVQKSIDGENFETIGKVKGHGSTSSFSSYSFNDDASENSTNYYRLKQVDYDGKFEYSKVVELINPAFVQAVNVYPNPSSDGKVTLMSNAFKSNTYSVYDMNGKLVETHVVSTNNYTLYLSPSSSLYYISYFDGAALHTIKVAVY